MKVVQTVVVLERLEPTSTLVLAAASKQAAAASMRTVSAAALHDPWSDIEKEVAALQRSAAAAVLWESKVERALAETKSSAAALASCLGTIGCKVAAEKLT